MSEHRVTLQRHDSRPAQPPEYPVLLSYNQEVQIWLRRFSSFWLRFTACGILAMVGASWSRLILRRRRRRRSARALIHRTERPRASLRSIRAAGGFAS